MKLRDRIVGRRRARSGGVLVLAMFAVSAMAVLAFTVTAVGHSSVGEQKSSNARIAARCEAEAGLGAALFDLSVTGNGSLGSAQAPISYAGGSYWVAATDLGGGFKSLVSTSRSNDLGQRLELVVKRQNTNVFRWATFGDQIVTLASNAHVDAYDSALGTYASQALTGSGSTLHALADGNVGSNGNILAKQNSKVWGSVQPGVSGTASIIGNATVSGSTTPATSPQALPPINWPSFASLGALTVAKNGTLNIPSGNTRYDTTWFNTGSTINITGPATVVFDSLQISSTAKINVNATAGPVAIYVQNNFIMSSNAMIASTTKRPLDVSLILNSDNIIDPDGIVDLDQIDLSSNSQIYGTIYAPNASITVNSNFELFGALIAKKVWLDSNSLLHFDEQLANIGNNGPGTYSPVCYRVLAAP